MIKYNDLGCTHRLRNQLLHLWVVDSTDLVIVEKILDCTVIFLKSEPLAIEVEPVGIRTRVDDVNVVRFILVARGNLRHARFCNQRDWGLTCIDRECDGCGNGFRFCRGQHDSLPSVPLESLPIRLECCQSIPD